MYTVFPHCGSFWRNPRSFQRETTKGGIEMNDVTCGVGTLSMTSIAVDQIVYRSCRVKGNARAPTMFFGTQKMFM